MKVFTNQTALVFDNTWSGLYRLTDGMAQGSQINQYVGNEIRLHKLELAYHVIPFATDTDYDRVCRLVVMQYLGLSTGGPVKNDVYDSTMGFAVTEECAFAKRLAYKRQKVKVLDDKPFRVRNGSSNSITGLAAPPWVLNLYQPRGSNDAFRKLTLTWKKGLRISMFSFLDLGDATSDNKIWVAPWTTTNPSAPSGTLYYRMTFTDA